MQAVRSCMIAILAAAAISVLLYGGAREVAAAPAPQPVPCVAGICVPVQLPPTMVPAPSPTPRPSPTATPSATASPLPPPSPGAPVPPLTPEANLQAISKWVFAGGNWSVCQIPIQLGLKLDPAKCPPDVAVTIKLPQAQDWFAPIYRRMITIAGLVMLPMLLLAFLQALLRGDLGLALKAAFFYVPLAVTLSAIAVGVTQTLLAVTDSFSAFMLSGYEGQVVAAIGSLAAVMAAGSAGSAFTVGPAAAGVIAAVVAIVTSLAVVIELVARQALIYAAVLFLPFAFAAMVWPQLARWALRLVEVLVTAVLAKFLIVSVLVLGAAAFTSPGGGGPFDSQVPPGTTLLVGLLLVGLAALSPLALWWMLPTFESAAAAQFHGAARAPVAAGSRTAEGAVHQLGMRRIWRQRQSSSSETGSVMVLRPGTTVIIRPPRYGLAQGEAGTPQPPPARTPGPPRPGRPGGGAVQTHASSAQDVHLKEARDGGRA
jgi:hypothetical protein